MPFARDENDVAPPRPNYNKRILDPRRLAPETLVRRYYLGGGSQWRHEDYFILKHPYRHGKDLRVPVRMLGGGVTTLSVADMGVIPYRDSQGYNRGAYTIALQDA